MKTAFIVIFFFIYSLIFFSCSPYIVEIDYDKHTKFSKYKTYKYIRQGKTAPISKFQNDINLKKFVSAIDKELSEKGYQRVDTRPDFQVVYHLRFQKKLDISTYGYRYWPDYGINDKYNQTRIFEEGSLIIDIIDKHKNQLVWRGTAEGVLNEGEDAEELINSLVKEILKEFPPQTNE